MRRSILMISLFLLVGQFVLGQKQAFILKGKLTKAQDGASISYAVIENGTTKSKAESDSLGDFAIKVKIGDILGIECVGFLPLKVTVTNDMPINISLEESAQKLNDVVVVGYGSQKRSDLTNAISTVDVEKTFASRPLSDPTKALQGVAPGLNINYSNGGLTTAASINIRGLGSVNGSSAPLILVDNVETSDLSIINPNDIASVSVLKDATASSIYGARAAFGVVLIKTKSGKFKQRTQVSYNSNYGLSQATVLPDFANPVQELQGLYEGSVRAGTQSPEIFGMNLQQLQAGIQNWQNKYSQNRKSDEMIPGEDFDMTPGAPTYFYRVWDVKKMMLRKMPSMQQNVRISGGSDNLSYYLSFGYNNNGGIMKMNPDEMKKYNITTGVTANITNWWKMDVRMLYRNFEYDAPYQYQNYWYYMWRWGSYFPYGTYEGHYFRFVPAYLKGAQTARTYDNYSRVDIGTTLKLAPHLTAQATYTIGKDNVLSHNVGGNITAWDFWSPGLSLATISSAGQNEVDYNSNRTNQNVLNAYVTYDNMFNSVHHFSAMAGANAESDEYIGFNAMRYKLLDPSKGELSLATGDQFATGNHSESAYAGYFGRINYDYKGKYLLEANTRYDGSSSFSPNKRWAWFSSFSAGWRLSKEKFMDFLKPLVADWKIRASYGKVGNQDVGGNYYIPTMSSTQINWMSGGNYVQAVSAPITVPQLLTWEKITTFDLGTDISFIDNHLSATFDWYQRDNDGMLSSQSVGATFGTSAPKINDGSMRTRGWEVQINGSVNPTKDWALYGTLSLADNKSVITSWNNPGKLLSSYYAGQTLNDIWGFETDRYFTAADFQKDANGNATATPADGIANQSNMVSGNFVFGPGDVKYKDLNNDGKIDAGGSSASDHGDLKVIGNTNPRYQYSVRIGSVYKNFDIDFFFQGIGKRSYWGTGNVAIPLYQGSDIMYAHQLDYWTPDNVNAKYPRPYVGNNSGRFSGIGNGGGNFYPQTKYLMNLAYLRLKNVNIGYTLPAGLLGKYRIQKMRIYASGENLFTISNVGLPIDPEAFDGYLGFTGRTWPMSKTFSFGVQVNFF